MARNKLSDLNNHLFAQLERLSDEEMPDEKLEKELKRQKAISELARDITDINKISLEALKLLAKGDVASEDLPKGIDTVTVKRIGN